MNEHLHVGEQFFRIVDEFENAPKDCRQTASGAALDAYRCPSGQWTIGDGCCFWDDGEPVKEGDTIPDGPDVEERLERLLAYNAKYCEEYVKKWVTVPLNQHQFDALCDFRFNTRETTLRDSSRLLPAINNQEWQKAALAMTEFVYGLSTHNGKPYQEAMEGLLRRRLWDALIFLSYDPVGAVTVKGTALPTTIKLMSSGVYRDVISSEGLTTLNQVRMRANPLPPSQATPAAVPASGLAAQRQSPAKSPAAGAAISETPAAVSPAPGAAVKSEVPQTLPPQVPAVIPKAVPPAPVGTKAKSPNTVAPADVPYKIDPQTGLKPLEETDRAKGYWWQQTGIGIIRLGSLGVFGTTLQGGAQALQGDPVLSNLVLTVVVLAGVAVTGYVIKVYGDWRRKRGEKAATQGMYGFILFALFGGLALEMLPSSALGNEPNAAVSYAVLDSEGVFALPSAQTGNDRPHFVVV